MVSIKYSFLIVSSHNRYIFPIGQVDPRTWDQVISLYPHLVNAASMQVASVMASLQGALHQYKHLLQAPASSNGGL